MTYLFRLFKANPFQLGCIFFTAAFSCASGLSGQSPIIQNIEFSDAQAIKTFPNLSGFYRFGETDGYHWLWDYNAVYLWNDTLQDGWTKLPQMTPLGYGYNGIWYENNYLYMSCYKTESINLTYYGTTNRIYRTHLREDSFELYSEQSYIINCGGNPNCSPWFVYARHPMAGVAVHFMYYQWNGQYHYRRLWSDDNGVHWYEGNPEVPEVNGKADSLYYAVDDTSLYISTGLDFMNFQKRAFPSPAVDQNNIKGIFQTQDTLLFVLKNGKVWQTADYGETWQENQLPFTEINAVRKSNDFFFCTTPNGLHRSNELLGVYVEIFPKGLAISGALDGFGATEHGELAIGIPYGGGIWHSTDSGNSWQPMFGGFPSSAPYKLSSLNNSIVATFGVHKNYWISDNAGQDWQLLNAPELSSFGPANIHVFENQAYALKPEVEPNKKSIWMSGDLLEWENCADTVLASDNADMQLKGARLFFGRSYDLSIADTNCTVNQIIVPPSDPQVAYVDLDLERMVISGDTLGALDVYHQSGSDKLVFFRSFDLGQHWEKRTVPFVSYPSYNRVFNLDTALLFATNNGEIWTSNDWGDSWQLRSRAFNNVAAQCQYEFKYGLLLMDVNYSTAYDGYYISPDLGYSWLRCQTEPRPVFKGFLLHGGDLYFNWDKYIFKTDPTGLFAAMDTLQAVSEVALQNDWEYKINISPNPASDAFMVTLPTAAAANIELINAFGQVVYKTKTHTKLIEISTYKVPVGIYWVRVNLGNVGTRVYPLVVQ